MRRTKIICTLGPATDKDGVLRLLMENGMNVARLNFSHGDHEEQLERIQNFKKLREELELPIGLLLDTKGPEIRLGAFKGGKTQLKSGQLFTLTTEEVEGSSEIVTISYKGLPSDVKAKDRILMDDGLIELKVMSVNGGDIQCKVINSGKISDKKSVNVPGINLNIPYVNEKDKADLIFGVKQNVDFVAASFCRSAYDVLEIKKILEDNGGQHIQIISKIENQDGVKNIDEILRVTDGIMIARGDMGVEIPFEELPRIQKELIKKCYRAGKKVITATQMLESMINNPRPTRAETTDVANAVYDGTSAIMLSGETAVGKYPVDSLRTMSRIAKKTENDINYVYRFKQLEMDTTYNVTNAISRATCMTAHDLDTSAIVTVTRSGYTARMISSFRPACPIISCATDKVTYHQLALSWGVLPVMSQMKNSTDDLFEHAVDMAMMTGILQHGDLVAITAGVPVGVSGTTNILKVHIVGNALVKGKGVNGLSSSGRVCVGQSLKDVNDSFQEGDILVMPTTDNTLLPIMRNASAIIVEESGSTCHAAIVGLTLEIPVICNAKSATDILKTGTIVTVDSTRGIVYSGVVKGI